MTFLTVLKALIPLLLIAALLYGVLIFVRKYGLSFKNKTGRGGLDIRLISTQMIMPKKFISVVKVEDKLLVLGISDHSINVLKELESSGIPQRSIAESVNNESFIGILKKNLGLK